MSQVISREKVIEEELDQGMMETRESLKKKISALRQILWKLDYGLCYYQVGSHQQNQRSEGSEITKMALKMAKRCQFLFEYKKQKLWFDRILTDGEKPYQLQHMSSFRIEKRQVQALGQSELGAVQNEKIQFYSKSSQKNFDHYRRVQQALLKYEQNNKFLVEVLDKQSDILTSNLNKEVQKLFLKNKTDPLSSKTQSLSLQQRFTEFQGRNKALCDSLQDTIEKIQDKNDLIKLCLSQLEPVISCNQPKAQHQRRCSSMLVRTQASISQSTFWKCKCRNVQDFDQPICQVCSFNLKKAGEPLDYIVADKNDFSSKLKLSDTLQSSCLKSFLGKSFCQQCKGAVYYEYKHDLKISIATCDECGISILQTNKDSELRNIQLSGDCYNTQASLCQHCHMKTLSTETKNQMKMLYISLYKCYACGKQSSIS